MRDRRPGGCEGNPDDPANAGRNPMPKALRGDLLLLASWVLAVVAVSLISGDWEYLLLAIGPALWLVVIGVGLVIYGIPPAEEGKEDARCGFLFGD